MESSFTFPKLDTNEEVSQVRFAFPSHASHKEYPGGRGTESNFHLTRSLILIILQNPLIAKATVSDSSRGSAGVPAKQIAPPANDKVKTTDGHCAVA